MSSGVGAARRLMRVSVIVGSMTVVGIFAAGCSTRSQAPDEPAPLAAAPPRQPSDVDRAPLQPAERQGIGAQKVWMDDPALRRGPNGQPAPYGRDTVTGRPLIELPATATPPGPSRPGAHRTVVVKRGDTLTGIARHHQVSVDALARANGLANDRIREGQTLVIPAR